MTKLPIDYSAIAHLAGVPVVVPAILAIAVPAVICLVLLAVITLILRLRSRLSKLSLVISSREEATPNLAVELEAQSRLVRQLSVDCEEIRKRIADQEASARADLPLWSASNAPVNLNRRGQILRLSRKGKSVPEIAQDLNVAQGEVELLLKVHD